MDELYELLDVDFDLSANVWKELSSLAKIAYNLQHNRRP